MAGIDRKPQPVEVGYLIMRHFLFAAIAALAFTVQAHALQEHVILGSDGNMYEGASPEQIERIIENARESEEVGGVMGNNVFVVVGENVTFIPVSDLRSLPKETQIAVVGDAVIQDLTGNDDITFKQVSAVAEVSEGTGLSVEEP